MPAYEPWRRREDAPWGERNPTVWEATRAYPGDAVRSGIITGFFCLIGGGTFAGGGTTAVVIAFIVWPILWWLAMFAEIRGWVEGEIGGA